MTIPLVFLDTNILLPQYLRVVMLDLADARLLVPHWSPEVLQEVRRNLYQFGVESAKTEKLIGVLGQAFPGALVEGYEKEKEKFIGKVDPKDVHVAAAAYNLSRRTRKTVVLVSHNLKDLPSEAFVGTLVRTARPGQFLKNLLDNHPVEVAETLIATCHRLKNPKLAPEDLLMILERSGCADFAASLAAVWGYGLDVSA